LVIAITGSFGEDAHHEQWGPAVHGVMILLGGPAADMTAGMQDDFEQADDAGVVDLDPG
jgi:hypothetical protein